MKNLFLLILLFSCSLTALSQKKVVDDKIALQQQIVEKQIVADNLENQVKEIPFAVVRVFVRYKTAVWLWKDGKDLSGRAEQILIRAVDDLYQNKSEISEMYFSILKPDLLILLDANAKEAADKLREKYEIRSVDESGTIDSWLKQKDGEKLATNAAIKALGTQSQIGIETIFLLGQLQSRKSTEFIRLLTAVVNAIETGRVEINPNDLLLMSGYTAEANIPLAVQEKILKIIVNHSRAAMYKPGVDADTAFNLLSLVMSEISAKLPELLPEAIIIQSSLRTRASQAYIKAQERADRIKSSPDKLSAYISEAEQTDNPAEKYDLYVSAAYLALKTGKFKYAVEIVEKTMDLDKSKFVSEAFRTEWRDQFFGEVVDKSLKAEDSVSADYAIKKMTDPLRKAAGLKKTAEYYFEKDETVTASFALDEAIKLTVKAENNPQRISSFINLISTARKIDQTRVSDLIELIGKSINLIPTLNVEDKPQTENYKNYVKSVMQINWVLLPALTTLIKDNKNEAANLANSINKKEIKIIAEYSLLTDSTFQMKNPEKQTSKR